ncbi:MAG: Ig-like domain-containing protein [Hominilimicola sp.]|uniref:Ig-like domain-containing protein n=1 Tax=Hominilimicola sp. TaxID=3073571 RepID=UPI003991F9D3
MPTIPKTQTLNASSVDILNAIRNSASTNYRDFVPTAKSTPESIRQIGEIIMQYTPLQNEFLNALVNRIARVIITSKMYSNPLSMFKKGLIDFGETIEEIFVNIANPHQYDVEESENKVFAREIPDVRAAFHTLNYKKFYKQTIQNKDLNQAFLSWDGITDLISKIVNAMYTAANYDEFVTTKYMLAKAILDGRLSAITVDANDAKGAVTKIKGVSNALTFMSNNYNVAGVQTFTDKNDQYLLVNSQFDSEIDVEVLASAFNMSKAEFMGHRILIDGFGTLDVARLNALFKDDPNYEEPSQDTLTALNAIPAVLVDKNFFMIFDNMYEFTENYNGQGLYWNYFYHTWKTFSMSPFANALVFVPAVPSVTSVSVSPTAITCKKGQSVQLSVSVETKNYAPKTVNWKSDTDGVTVDINGHVTVATSVKEKTAKITATSTYDNTKSGECSVTITE